jgi:hypothetical protein
MPVILASDIDNDIDNDVNMCNCSEAQDVTGRETTA